MILVHKTLKTTMVRLFFYMVSTILIAFISAFYIISYQFESELRLELRNASEITVSNYVNGDIFLLRRQLDILAKLRNWRKGELQNLDGSLLWTLEDSKYSKNDSVLFFIPFIQFLSLVLESEIVDNHFLKVSEVLKFQDGTIIGTISMEKELNPLVYAFVKVGFIVILVFLFFTLGYLYVMRNSLINNLKPLVELRGNVLSEASKINLKLKTHIEHDEIVQLREWFKEISEEWLAEKNNSLIYERKAAQSELAEQVAHDIKSPISALEIVMDDLSVLPEESRTLTLHAIDRIRGIASSLSKKRVDTEDRNTNVLVSVFLKNLINEKRLEFQRLKNIKVVFVDNTNGLLFFLINEHEFGRVISNLINNSVEAMKQSGEIHIILDQSRDNILIKIEDNGVGFPEILLKEGVSRGKTIGKEGGHGLGLYHANETVKAAGGSFHISNLSNGGASIRIEFVSSRNPTWFPLCVNLRGISKVVLVDDDQSIHDTWNSIFRKMKFTNEILSFYSPDQVLNYLSKSSNGLDETIFFIDFDFNFEMNGIDLIKKLKKEKTILVTSNYTKLEIINFCKKENILMIPKQVIRLIDIKSFS